MNSQRFRPDVAGPLVCFALVSLWAPVAFGQELCRNFGPQTPRDISQKGGSNPVTFNFAPEFSDMTLCNIHLHKNAEHRAPDYSTFVGPGKFGGYACGEGGTGQGKPVCRNVQAGETVEVHWVYTTCDVDPKPGEGLDACTSASCANPQLRVEAQVFRVEADGGEDFAEYASVPPPDDDVVKYLGSTTADNLSSANCSPLQVSWSVRPQCRSLNLAKLGAWCSENRFDERTAHGVRQLVTEQPLLSKIDD